MATLILLPGLDGTGRLFEPFISALGREFSVKVVRYPTDEPLGYSELELVAGATLPADGPFVLLGESFSGPIAVSLAASQPQRLKGLVLCCTFVRNPRPVLSWLRSFVGILPAGTAPIGLLSHFLLGTFSTTKLRSALANALAEVSPSVIRARLASVLSVDVSAQLAAIKVPILYLRASRDRLVPRSASEIVSRLLPRTAIVEIEGPHFLLQASPAKAAQVVGEFLRKVQSD